ncbi:4Fe-4S dicluster domain-containing protein [bacterium]|nr:4Fe-4S dicluster domain-containing protein [bacterium]
MRKPKLRELKEAIRAVILGPYTSKFPAEPSPAADAYRGKGEFDEDTCIACGGCAEVCPAGAIEVQDRLDQDPPVRAIVRYHDRCVFCGLCEDNCATTTGIHLTSEYDLSCFDRADCIVSTEKPLAICEMCGCAIAAYAHLRWVAEEVGALRFANPTLALVVEPRPSLEPIPARDKDRPPGRSDILRVLCPNCRRAVILTEVWG